jgi:hypothetical protein
VEFDGDLNLEARLAINRKISVQLPGFILSNFKPLENSDLFCVDFSIHGTLSKPRTNLVERVLGREIKQKAVDIFRSFFGSGKKRGGGVPPEPGAGPQ